MTDGRESKTPDRRGRRGTRGREAGVGERISCRRLTEGDTKTGSRGNPLFHQPAAAVSIAFREDPGRDEMARQGREVLHVVSTGPCHPLLTFQGPQGL